MEIQGNIVPVTWYKTIVTEAGKSHMLAIAILADIVCGFKVKAKRDVDTGEVIGLEKKNTEDMLRRSYSMYEDLFGENNKNIQRAIVALEKKGIVQRSFLLVRESDGKIKTNEMYMKLNMEVLYEVTYPIELPERIRKEKCKTLKRNKQSGQGCLSRKISTNERIGHQCPRCTRCLLHSKETVKDVNMEIELIELALQRMAERMYEE